MKGVQFLIDEKGIRTGVLIDLKKNGKLWEDFFDLALARERQQEPRESLEAVKEQLNKVKRQSHGEYSIVFARSARKELVALAPKLAQRVLTNIEGLQRDPHPPGSRKLEGSVKLQP